MTSGMQAIVVGSRAMTMSDDAAASFGFRDVPEAEKEGLVREVFSSVARRYDLMNDLMSGGVHRLWKDAFVDWLNPQPGWRVLDVAGGTGDIAFRIADAWRAKRGGEAAITVCDINARHAERGRAPRRRRRRGCHRLGLRRRRNAAGPGLRAWTPIRSPSASATSRISTRAGRSPSRAETRRTFSVPGIFARRGAGSRCALRAVFSFNVLPRLGEMVAGDARGLSLSRRKHPPLSAAERLRAR